MSESEFKIKNKIQEIRSYIASDWPGIEERKTLYKNLQELEKELKELLENEKNKS